MSRARDLANLPARDGDIKAGTTAFFAMSTAPGGWLKANGAAVSRTTYADLFAALGTTYGTGDGSTTFNLPDLRGEFMRGWDDGRGVDSGRAIGTAQLDQMQRITGSVTGSWVRRSVGSTDGALSQSVRSTSSGLRFQGGDFGDGINFFFDSSDSPNSRTSATTDGETRSRNVALLACIKF
jgi:phage-related tail fiber protein